ncbi:PKD domain-containing protein [Candidatus Gracilibacteria bacterium]|nr:PKD domain-containing protein [Candidatus Gracilibacteria bacterium]
MNETNNTTDLNPTTPSTTPLTPSAPTPQATPPKPKNTLRKLLLVIGATFGVFFITAFALVALTKPDSESPLAAAFGFTDFQFISGLILYIHAIFAIAALTILVFTLIALFRAAKTPIADLIIKKAKTKKATIFVASLLAFMFIWGGSYLFLDAKRPIDPDSIPQVITTPEDTLNLSAPIEVIFNAAEFAFDQSKYQIVSHNWNFGDTETATGQIVSHRYTEKGTFEVTLEIVLRNKKTGTLESGGTHNLVVSVTNEALSAKFSADPQTGGIPLKVQLDASESTDPDGFIETYEWDLDNDGRFDDGEGQQLEHTFEKIGKYLVKLRVTSSTGEFNIAEKQINAIKEQIPTAEITILNEPDNFLVGNSYNFQATEANSPNGQVQRYVWDFGDGSRSQTGSKASKTFAAPGTYQVTLTLTDETGVEGSVKRIITIGTLGSAPRAVLQTIPALAANTTKLQGTAPFTVQFSGENSLDSDNDIDLYGWDLDGDKTSDQFGENLNYTFQNAGTYNVTLQVTDRDGNKGSATITVEVLDQGLSALVTADKIEGTVPLTVNFDASASSYNGGQITSYLWDFGDNTGEKLGAAKISHKYTTIGTYNAEMTAIAADGTRSSKTIIITVRETPLAACFDSVFQSGPAPLTTTFDPSCSTGTISSYFWNFSDGGTSTQAKPIYTFTEPGLYTVTLEISDSTSNISEFSKVIEVGE